MGYLVGDCLVAAAFLSYAGPFLSNYRDELVQQTWLKQVNTPPLFNPFSPPLLVQFNVIIRYPTFSLSFSVLYC